MASTFEMVESDLTAQEIEPKLAEQLLHRGALFILLNMPEGCQFGINGNCWITGPKFKGLKMIPPGIHFIHYCATNKQGGVAPRIGFFEFFKERNCVVRRYDPQTEDIVEEQISDEELEAYRSRLQEIDQFLAPYPYNTHRQWFSQTNYISEEIMRRLQPLSRSITSQSDLVTKEADEYGAGPSIVDREHPIRRRFFDSEGLPMMRLKEGTEIRFSKIPRERFPIGASASEKTAYSMDCSFALSSLLDSYNNNASKSTTDSRHAEQFLLGELQFSYCCFMFGHVYEGFEHWKSLVTLCCSCDEALVTRERLFCDFISCLFFQLKYMPSDFFVDIVERNNFLVDKLTNLFALIDGNRQVSQSLRSKAAKFKNFLTEKYHWDFSQESDEYLPVIVS